MDKEFKTLEQIKQTAITLGVQFGPKVLVAIVLLVVGSLAGQWVGGLTDRGLRRFHLEPPVRQLLVRLVRMIVISLFGIMALQNLGVELLPLIAGLGVAGAGVALAMQGVLGNIVAGLTIIFTKPFRVGEYISIAGEEGRVDVITVSSTSLSHPDMSQVVIPNRKIVGEILHNYGTIRQVQIDVNVAYDTDLDLVLATAAEVLNANPRVLKSPQAVVQVGTVANGAITIMVRPWTTVTDYAACGSELKKAIVEAFRAHNIAIAVPLREVRLVGDSPAE
jgi:small conductance mechanosensitive channel